MKCAYAVSLAALTASLVVTRPSMATPTEKLLNTFWGLAEGQQPLSGVIRDASGNLYGTTAGVEYDSRRKKAVSTVFEVTPPSPGTEVWVEKTLHTFEGESAGDGASAYGGLVMDASGSLYGTTAGGGVGRGGGGGTVYRLTPPAAGQTNWTETILHAFTGGTDGASPVGSLIFDKAGVLYGTTSGGNGTVFKLTPPAQGGTDWVNSTLYTFQGGTDGAGPQSAVAMDRTGALYGTTLGGGAGTACNGSGCGTVFMLTPPEEGQTSWTEAVLYTFTGGADGRSPAGSVVIDKSGALYGVTSVGGNTLCPQQTCGVAYKVSPPAAGQSAWTETVVYAFNNAPDAYSPGGPLTFDPSGNLFGTAGGGSDNTGAVFELSPPAAGQTAWTESIFYSFPSNYQDGVGPSGGVHRDAAGDFFGVTQGGGDHHDSHAVYGTVYELKQ